MPVADLARRCRELGITQAGDDPGGGYSRVRILDQPVEPGDLYVLLPDNIDDETAVLDAAFSAGAVAAVSQPGTSATADLRVLPVTDLRRALAAAGAVLHRDPAVAV